MVLHSPPEVAIIRGRSSQRGYSQLQEDDDDTVHCFIVAKGDDISQAPELREADHKQARRKSTV